MESLLNLVLDWYGAYKANVLWSLVVIFLYFIITRLTLPLVEKLVNRSGIKSDSASKAYHIVRILSATLTVGILLFVWGIDFAGLMLLSTSLLTLTGVALFANWSILSNVTSYFVLLVQSAYVRGNFVRIIDGDNYIEGYIADIGIFATKLITENREIVIYPNNLFVVRPTVINPRNKWNMIGKTNENLISKGDAAKL